MRGPAFALSKPIEPVSTWDISKDEIIVGKDVLELLSSSMYLDPITIFREYVQNSADAIDQARHRGHLSDNGCVEIDLDPTLRTIRIRDNGVGVPTDEFGKRLTSFGASTKRGTAARGFRGVGRLAGLGYCQELIFRSRSSADAAVSVLRWDCRRLRSALREIGQGGDLVSLVREVVTIDRVDGRDWPKHFFEVELKGVIRHRNDRLLSASSVGEYLSQVAPVPFSPLFRFGPQISAALSRHVEMGDLEIRIAGNASHVTRPHLDRLEIGDNRFDDFKEIEFKEIPAHDGGIAAIAWFLHHGYVGAIPARALIKGPRFRVGNVQVGDHLLMEDLFAEPRFNGWSVGEIHVLDKRILPNGRRDQFEQNVHYDNLLNQLAPVAREISRKCRTSSVDRKLLREFELYEEGIKQQFSIVAQGSFSSAKRTKLLDEINRSIGSMERVAEKLLAGELDDRGLGKVIERFRLKLQKITKEGYRSAFARLPKTKREIYEQVFSLIYECSANQSAAKSLVDRLLKKIG